MTDTHALGSFTVIIVLFLIVLAILWFLLPFAIFGTKNKLDQLIHEAKKTNQELVILLRQQNLWVIFPHFRKTGVHAG